MRSSKEELLPIIFSFGEKEQFLAVPKLESSSGRDQAEVVLNAHNYWNLIDKLQIMFCDTTASNSLSSGTKLTSKILVHELVLKKVSESKIQQVTSQQSVVLFIFDEEFDEQTN